MRYNDVCIFMSEAISFVSFVDLWNGSHQHTSRMQTH